MRGLGLIFAWGCAGGGAGTPSATTPSTTSDPPTDSAPTMPTGEGPSADVLQVAATGAEGAYDFSVTLRSDDTDCTQYADWWEVVSADGELLYRRILTHSHAADQPFARSGGPVPIGADQEVFVRGHMNPQGYQGVVFGGTATGGFVAVQEPGGFPPELEGSPPQPDGCAF